MNGILRRWGQRRRAGVWAVALSAMALIPAAASSGATAPYAENFDGVAAGDNPVPNFTESNTAAYTVVDARLGWRPRRDTELSLLVQNVLDKDHAEFGPVATRASFGRSWFAKATWVF